MATIKSFADILWTKESAQSLKHECNEWDDYRKKYSDDKSRRHKKKKQHLRAIKQVKED